MIGYLKKVFAETATDADDSETTRKIAAAALLVEVARADFEQTADEEATMAKLLEETLGLSPSVIQTLIAEAGDAVDSATSLYQFTRDINDEYSYEEKCALVESMWQVAYADGSIDKYEEHLIRRVSDLIYVNHEDFIKTKHRARDSAAR